MHRNTVPDVFDIPPPKHDNTLPWLTVLSIAAVAVAGSLVLGFAGGFY